MLESYNLNKNFKKYDITTKRRAIQAFFLFLYFIFPLFGIFYYDVNATSFILLGKTVGVNNSVIFVIGFIAILVGVVAMAITTGRSFCGWVCPQNFLSEIINKIIKKFALKNDGSKKIIPYIVITLATVIISLSVAINFMFYFGKPVDVLNSLISGQLNGNVMIFAILFGLLVFAGIGIFRHDFCKFACPYGIMQASVADKTTIRVRFTKERSSDCINCNACNEVCYVGIEPRKLVQADPGCMNCGLCVEACHNILEPMGIKKTLEFSKEKDSKKESLNNKASLVLVSTFITFSIAFIYMFVTLPIIDITLTRDDRNVSVTKNGYLISDYFLQILNQSSDSKNITLKVDGLPEKYISFEKNDLNIKQGENIKFQIKFKAPKNELKPGIKQFNIVAYDKLDNKELYRAKTSLFIPFE